MMFDKLRAWLALRRTANRETESSIPAAAPQSFEPQESRSADVVVFEHPTDPRTERLAERLLEDETLRGNLEDMAWQPIQDWALEILGDLARRTKDLDDPEAAPVLDRAYSSLRQAIGALADIAEHGPESSEVSKPMETLRATLVPPLMDARTGSVRADRAAAVAARLKADRATSAHAANRLISALRGSASERHTP
jgi:hypothetical protein